MTLVELSLGSPKILSQLLSFFKLSQWQFNVAMYNVQGAYGESAFEELDEILYIVQPNNIFL